MRRTHSFTHRPSLALKRVGAHRYSGPVDRFAATGPPRPALPLWQHFGGEGLAVRALGRLALGLAVQKFGVALVDLEDAMGGEGGRGGRGRGMTCDVKRGRVAGRRFRERGRGVVVKEGVQRAAAGGDGGVGTRGPLKGLWGRKR